MKADVYDAFRLKETPLVHKLREQYKQSVGQKIMFIGTATEGSRRIQIELDLKNLIINIIYHAEG